MKTWKNAKKNVKIPWKCEIMTKTIETTVKHVNNG